MQKTLFFSILFVILIKILFIVYEIFYVTQKRNNKVNSNTIYWKEKFEWLFQLLMLLILIHIFYPWKNDIKSLTPEIRHLIFIYSVLVLFTLLWNNFF